MNIYDRYGFAHDKNCINGEASSNNPAIYSAMDEILTGNKKDFSSVFASMLSINYPENSFTLIRHPDNKDLVTSLDEIIGWIKLGYLDSNLLKKFDWMFSDQDRRVPTWKIIKAMIYIAGEHRNFFQDKKVTDVHPVVFRIPFYIRFFTLKKDKRKIKLSYRIAFYLYFMSTILKRNYKNKKIKLINGSEITILDKQTNNISAKNILFIILQDLDSKFLIRFINYKKNINDYFEGDHPFKKLVETYEENKTKATKEIY